jgi:two-component system cell cycle sensor histidine kinase/response regulator CckA
MTSEPDLPLRLLLVEDSESDAGLIVREFHRAGLHVEFERVENEGAFRAALAAGPWNAVICDYSLPGFGAGEALEALRQAGGDLPFLVVSGTIPDRTAVELMRSGAHDYLLKDNLTRLVPATLREINEAGERRNRRLAERALRESVERLGLAQVAAAIGVFDVDLAGDFATWTAEEEAIFGFAPGTFDHTSATFWSLVHPEDRERIQGEVTAAIAARAEINSEYRFHRHGDNALRWVMMRGKAFYDEAGRPVRLLGVNIDITSRKEAEEAHRNLEAQLRQAQKMEAVGRLSGGVAHDFNNMLTVILGNVSLIEIDGGLPASVRESLAEIKETAKRAANLTRQLLAFSRRHPMQLADLDLNVVMADIGRMLQRLLGEDIRLQLQPAPHPAMVRADVGMIEQILLNLAVNARDAMPRGGLLSMAVDLREIPPMMVPPIPDARAGRFVCLTVSDTGCGMTPEVRARIFEPFFTTKEVGKGTGLGLATVYTVVQRHEGWVDVHSEVGNGTIFRIFLPRLAGESNPPVDAPEEAPALAAPRGITILLVEDEKAVRALARTVLTRHGYRVHEAASGIKALELWARHRDEIGLLLTDLVMPDGMSGMDLAARLTRERSGLPVVYMSGYSKELAGRDFPAHERTNFLTKPFDHATLLRIVHDTLAGRTTNSS